MSEAVARQLVCVIDMLAAPSNFRDITKVCQGYCRCHVVDKRYLLSLCEGYCGFIGYRLVDGVPNM